MANPEPMADFFDAFLIGDGEEAVLAINEVVRAHRGGPRQSLLRALADIPVSMSPPSTRWYTMGT